MRELIKCQNIFVKHYSFLFCVYVFWYLICYIFFLDSFQDQMKRELSYREEMVQQLQIVRGKRSTSHDSFCTETTTH